MEFATGALGTLLPKLGQLLQDEYNLHKGAKKNIESLKRELESIHAALCSVGEVRLDELSELVRTWARDARELSYDMEDIVDTFLVRVQGVDPPTKKSFKRLINNKMKDIFTKAKIQHDIGQEIKNINERVMEVAKRRERYGFAAITSAKTCDVDPRITSLYTKAADLVGIDEASKEIIMRLRLGDDTPVQKQRIVSIVGFGGLGKTTLAKVVYDDDLKGKFDCTAFVPVGRTPDLKKVFKEMLIKLDKKKYIDFNFGTLDYERQFIDELRDFLKNKRYFIVIDDVWDTKSWEVIKLALVENNRGSRVIITTRTRTVAREADGIYELQPLSHDNSKKLFFARIFGGEIKSTNRQPDDEVSDKILRKCGGIPLAIITMASLLVGKPREVWSEVHHSIGVGNKENQQAVDTMKILSFSYYDLSSRLKTCLLYLSVFPEDYFIEKGPLIWMWIAEGFVHKEQGKSLFETGEKYFNELVNRSMIQLVEKDSNIYYDVVVPGCQVHDMVLDLIRSISSEVNFVTILDSNEGSSSSLQGKVRRLALQNNMTVAAHVDMQQVRSLISYQCDLDKGVPFLGFKLIRVLAIYAASSKDFEINHLEHLKDLLHLRYLQLSGDIIDLPEGTGSLKFLQTLDVNGLFGEQVLKSMDHLTQLLCLRFRCGTQRVPDGIGKLTSLQELEIHYEGDEEETCRQFVKELGNLRELRVLCLGMPRMMELVPYLVELLRNLEKLEQLTLTYIFRVDTTKWEAAGFLLPRRLRQLFLYMINFSRFPSLCMNRSCLPNLSHLSLLLEYIDEQDLRILGGLPELRFLSLTVMNTMELVCNTGSTTDATGDGYLFQKLRRCFLDYNSDVRVLSSKDDTGGVSFRLWYMKCSLMLGSQSGKGVAPTLMPSAQTLKFSVHVREFEGGCASLSLEYFASVRNVGVRINCSGASAAAVEEVEAVLRHAADVHPNRPKLDMTRILENNMVSAAEDQEFQSDTSSEED